MKLQNRLSTRSCETARTACIEAQSYPNARSSNTQDLDMERSVRQNPRLSNNGRFLWGVFRSATKLDVQ